MESLKRMVFLATILCLISCVSSEKSDTTESEPMREVDELNDRVWIKRIMHPGDQTNMLIFFANSTCSDCRKQATTLAKLANHTEGTPVIARAYCDLQA